MGFRRDDVELAAVRLEQHVRGLAGEFKICHQDATAQVHHGDAALGAAEDEGHRAVRQDSDVFGLRHDANCCALGQRPSVVDAEGAVVAIHHQDGFSVRSDPREDGFVAGGGSRDDGVRLSVQRQEHVVAGSRGVKPFAIPGKFDGVGKRAHGNARGDLVDAGIENPDVAARAADTKDFGARGMLAQSGKARADIHVRKGFELDEVDHSDAAVGGGDIGIKPHTRAKKRGAMLAQKQGQSGEGQGGEKEVDAKVLEAIHVRHGILPCGS